MFWLERPPVLRWIAAGLLIALSAALDLAGAATTPYPFVAVPVARGESLTPDVVEWRDVPVGLLGDPSVLSGHATRDLAPGDPLTRGTVSDGGAVPVGWWAVPVELPEGARVGGAVRLVALEPSLDVEGVVAAVPLAGAFSIASPGLVAVPPDTAGIVAAAASSGRLVVLLGT